MSKDSTQNTVSPESVKTLSIPALLRTVETIAQEQQTQTPHLSPFDLLRDAVHLAEMQTADVPSHWHLVLAQRVELVNEFNDWIIAQYTQRKGKLWRQERECEGLRLLVQDSSAFEHRSAIEEQYRRECARYFDSRAAIMPFEDYYGIAISREDEAGVAIDNPAVRALWDAFMKQRIENVGAPVREVAA